MNVLIDQPHLIDTLRYRAQVQRTLPQEDVKVGVLVHVLVRSGERDRGALEKRIREALEAFIAAPWVLAGIQRQADTVGYERIELRASARVPVAENYSLDERARRASSEGLTITSPTVGYALSAERVSEVLEELRLEVVSGAQKQAARFREATGRDWRIGDIAFGVEDIGSPLRPTGKGAYRLEQGFCEPGDDEIDADEGRGLAGAERIHLIATVTLKAAVAVGGGARAA